MAQFDLGRQILLANQIRAQQQQSQAIEQQQAQRNAISELIQGSAAPDLQNPFANLLFGSAGITGNPALLAQAADIERRQGLTDFRNDLISQLSGGQSPSIPGGGMNPAISAALISNDPGLTRFATTAIQQQQRQQEIERQDLQRQEDISRQADIRTQTQEQKLLSEQRAEERSRRKALRQAKVPGFTIQEGFTPSIDDAKKLKTANTSAKNIEQFVGEMNDILRKSTIRDRLKPGTTQRKLRQLFTKLQLQAKNIEELGVLAGPDLDLINTLQVNPVSLANQRFDEQELIDLNNQLVNFARQQTDNIAESAGFSRDVPRGTNIDLNQFFRADQ